MIKQFFQIDRYYKKRFNKIWLWKEYPDNKGEKDTGIDLVAKDKYGHHVGIQCKFYDKDARITYEDISKFFISCEHHKIEKYLLVHTAAHITDQSEKIINEKKCQILDKHKLENCAIKWNEIPSKILTKPTKKLYKWQQSALEDTIKGFEKKSRGQLIMACGTGKTLTSLRITEDLEKNNGCKLVLYLVPSISLIQQTMREWSENTEDKHNYIAVCSDSTVKDNEEGEISELEETPSTDKESFIKQIRDRSKKNMTIIFSTYHSIQIVVDGLKATSVKEVDIIFCDEAHRTTGLEKTKESLKKNQDRDNYYTIVHKNSNISARRRLYMTATPKVYNTKIQGGGFEIYSMDRADIYGDVFHELSFYDAVHKYHALSDFRVKIAILPEDKLVEYLKIVEAGADENESEDNKNKAKVLQHKAKYAAVWHAILHPDDMKTMNPLQKIIVFTNKIEGSKVFSGLVNKKDHVSFETVAVEYNKSYMRKGMQTVKTEHIDGKSKASARRTHLDWLKKSHKYKKESRIISNAKCLSEGVDVPSLDGVVFLEPKKSSIDVVQSVGRVMRKKIRTSASGISEDRYGYVILPVIVPSTGDPNKILDDNEPFRLVWQVLNALRSHDPLLVPEISTLNLSSPKHGSTKNDPRIDFYFLGIDPEKETQLYTDLVIKMRSKLVAKVGETDYVKNYGIKLGIASENVMKKLEEITDTDESCKKVICEFHEQMKDIVNPKISPKDIMKIISQHVILKHVFDLLFTGKFTTHNPIAKKLDFVIKKIGLNHLTVNLGDFYDTVKKEIDIINNSPQEELREKRQNFIKTIYQSFFDSTEKAESEKAGVVYTPIEIIDFINNSVQHILKTRFEKEYSSPDVKILDPFTGTGTFLSRLIDSGMLDKSLESKYNEGLFANEYILLAYYVASVNIETTFTVRLNELKRKNKYIPFSNMNYTDTLFQDPNTHDEKKKVPSVDTKITDDENIMELRKRMDKQNTQKLCVIEGNPPYSRNQKNADKRNFNESYPRLIEQVNITYGRKSAYDNKNSLHDSYIQSLRWASDRMGETGIIAFIIPTSFIKLPSLDGVRACLQDEFDEIWCFDLRGAVRSKNWKKEGGKIFGSNSTTPVAVAIFVKNEKKKRCSIHYKDIGDYLPTENKLDIIKKFKSINGIKDWKKITPNKYHDWINHRNQTLLSYTPIGNKMSKKNGVGSTIFKTYSGGIQTKRDQWAYNSSIDELSKNMNIHVNYCKKCNYEKPDEVDPKKGKWSTGLTKRLKKYRPEFDSTKIIEVLYRPFFKQKIYYDETFVSGTGNLKVFFPPNDSNLVISVSDKDYTTFSVFITDMPQDGEVVYHNQCFPLYTYSNSGNPVQRRKDNITAFALNEYKEYYDDETILKEDIFYYVYGMLHHEGYKKEFSSNLSKELPRIPMATDLFHEYKDAGKNLADIHLKYETKGRRFCLDKPKHYPKSFQKISFGKNDKDQIDKTKILINGEEIFDNIPIINYSVNGKTPLEWIIEKYSLTKYKKSDITNNPCEDKDPIDLIERAVYIGIESDKIISKLSKYEHKQKDWQSARTGLDAY